MAISSVNTYNAVAENVYATQKKQVSEQEETRGSTTSKVQSSKEKVEEYYQKLCKKFPQISFNTNGGELRCNSGKVVVNLSYECLKKMANDPEFAKEIEYNLSGEVQANAMTYGWAKRDGVELGGRIVTYDTNGNRTSSCGGMRTANTGNSSVSKSQDKSDSLEERIRKKREEKEAVEDRLEKGRRKREEFEDRLEEMRQEREAYLEHYFEGNSEFNQYQRVELTQVKSHFDANA